MRRGGPGEPRWLNDRMFAAFGRHQAPVLAQPQPYVKVVCVTTGESGNLDRMACAVGRMG